MEFKVNRGITKCKLCDKEFLPNSRNQLYHNAKCKRKADIIKQKERRKQTVAEFIATKAFVSETDVNNLNS